MYPLNRNRRLRTKETLRSLIRETVITPNDFLVPLFVIEGENMLNVASVTIGDIEQVLGARTANSLEIPAPSTDTVTGFEQEMIIADSEGRSDSITVDVVHILISEIDVVTTTSRFDFIELMTGINEPIVLSNYVVVLFQSINFFQKKIRLLSSQ